MKASLYTKIILMFVILMVTVMAVVGTVLLNSVFWFYSDEFSNQMEAMLGEGTLVLGAGEKSGALITAKYAMEQNKPVLRFHTRRNRAGATAVTR